MTNEETTPNLTMTEPIAGLDDLTTEVKPKRRRRTKEEIAAQSSSTGGSVGGKLKRDLDEIRTALSALFTVIGTALQFYNRIDGMIFIEKSTDVIEALVGIARTNDKVREMLLQFATVSGYGALASALVMMAIPIAANHNLLPKAVLFTAGLSNETLDAAFASIETRTNENKTRPMGNV